MVVTRHGRDWSIPVARILRRGIREKVRSELADAFTIPARMPPSLLGGGMASGGLGAAAPIENLPADNAPQLAAGLFTWADWYLPVMRDIDHMGQEALTSSPLRSALHSRGKDD